MARRRGAGDWTKVVRTFREGHQEEWWALEVEAGPYGTPRTQRAFVVTTDPKGSPDLVPWCLTTNLPAPGSERGNEEGALAPASVWDVVRLYGLRMWVEQSHKQVKHALGFSAYQVRSDVAIRRHWQLVCCAFSFCWRAYGHLPADDEPAERPEGDLPAVSSGRGERRMPASWPEALRAVRGWLEPWILNALAILEGVL